MIEEISGALNPAAAQRWLSFPRYRRYLQIAADDHDIAMEAYVWNSQVAAAGLADLGHLEVALRNAYDAQLSAKFPDWAIDSASGLFALEQGVDRARERQRRRNAVSVSRLAAARRGFGASPTHAEVVAALTFGFWSSLTVSERTPTLWNPMLNRAMPRGTQRAHVHDLVRRMVKFRNRLAHNEPVFSTHTGLAMRLGDMKSLFLLIDPEVYQFVAHQSQLGEALARCPIANLTSAQGLP